MNYELKNLLLLTALLLLSCSTDDEDVFYPKDYSQFTEDSRFGVRWKIDDPNDLGERCLDAVGLQAKMAVGSKMGYSDFDSIFPWRDIRRCNVRMEDGEPVVTYDDEPGFTLDGTNGDVMVRIPKFYVEKYTSGGYEYRVIAARGTRPHPAFIEDGTELDAIYISAFEGSMTTDSLLRSMADVIPTSNITAQRFLETAQRRGPQYTLYDMRCVDLLFALIAVEFGCRNTGKIFGYGIADYKQPLEKEHEPTVLYYSLKNQTATNTITCKKQNKNLIAMGTNICICRGHQRDILTFARCTGIRVKGCECTYTFDGPPINITTDCFIGSCAQSTNWIETCSAPCRSATGRANIIEPHFDPELRNPMRYRWMENLVGNVWHYLPDITFVDTRMYVCPNMKDYAFAYWPPVGYATYGTALPDSRELGTLDDTRGTNRWVTTLMDDTDGLGITFGNGYSNTLTSQQAFGAYYYVYDDHDICANGGGFDHKNRCNLLTTRAWVHVNERWHLYGARLVMKPVPAP